MICGLLIMVNQIKGKNAKGYFLFCLINDCRGQNAERPKDLKPKKQGFLLGICKKKQQTKLGTSWAGKAL